MDIEKMNKDLIDGVKNFLTQMFGPMLTVRGVNPELDAIFNNMDGIITKAPKDIALADINGIRNFKEVLDKTPLAYAGIKTQLNNAFQDNIGIPLREIQQNQLPVIVAAALRSFLSSHEETLTKVNTLLGSIQLESVSVLSIKFDDLLARLKSSKVSAKFQEHNNNNTGRAAFEFAQETLDDARGFIDQMSKVHWGQGKYDLSKDDLTPAFADKVTKACASYTSNIEPLIHQYRMMKGAGRLFP